MKRIVLASFASKLHGESYYSSIYEKIREYVTRVETNIEFTPVLTSEDEARETALKYKDMYPILVALTGGTSALMQKFAQVANYESLIIFGHGEHNSLPSAISARSKLDINGAWTWLFHCKNIDSINCFIEIQRMLRIARSVSSILNSKILLINPNEEKPEQADDFESKFNATVEVISMDKVASKLESARKDLVDHFLTKFDEVNFKIHKDGLINVARFYAVVKSIIEEGEYDAVAVNCFPYLMKYKLTPCLALALLNSEGLIAACEGDLLSLVLMMISKSLTGVSGWIANATAFEGEKAYFSHCTIALNMVNNPMVVSHFESSQPFSITGTLTNNVYTITSLSPDYSILVSGLGRVITSGLLYGSMCRTQAILDLGLQAEKIPVIAVSNHHVLIPGDVREDLKAVATLLGLEYLEYNDVVESTA